MITVSAEFLSALRSDSVTIKPKIEIQWDGASWTDETEYVTAFTLTKRVDDPRSVALGGNDGEDGGTITFSNATYRFSSHRSTGDSALRTYLTSLWGATGKRIRVSIGVWTGAAYEYCRIWSGYIEDLQEDGGTRATAHVRDTSWFLYQHRMTTDTMTGYRTDQIINQILNDAGWYDSYVGMLDTAIFTIPVAWLFDDTAGSEIKAVAAAVAGRTWCDVYDVLHFEDAGKWLTYSAVLTLAANEVKISPPSAKTDLLASDVVVEYAPRLQGQEDVLKTLESVKIVPPGGTVTFELRFNEPAYSITTPEKVTDYWIDNGSGVPLNDIVTVGITKYSQKVDVTVTNPHATWSAVIKYFAVRGIPLVGGPSEQVRVVINADPFVSRTRTHNGDVYVQTKNQATYLANLYASKYGNPTLKWNMTTAPFPQLEIGDRVTVSDSAYTARDGHVTAITHNFTQSGNSGLPYSQNIELLDRSSLGPSASYFVVGTSALGAGVAWF